MILIVDWISRLTISNKVIPYSERNHNDSSDASMLLMRSCGLATIVEKSIEYFAILIRISLP